ncbi:HAD hydrolase-like protein [candidate division FCPU426 bacterium]|nr:HAD hydrolase-like protein [candidate division FCPU426 bacterium]
MKDFTLFLFDVDATLIRTGGVGLRVMSRAFEEIMGWQDALAGISMAGRTDPSIAQEVSRQRRGKDMTAPELETVWARYLELLRQQLQEADTYRVLPGIPEFLRKISGQAGFALGLGTGNLEAGARIKLERADLNKYFPFGGFGSDAVERAEVLRIGVSRGERYLGRSLTNRQIVIVGDTPHDIAAGKELAARTLAVATGPYSLEQLAAFQPDLAIQDFTDQTAVDAFC